MSDVATPETAKENPADTPQKWIDHAWDQFPDKTPASQRALFAWAYLQALRRPGEVSEAAQQLGIEGIPTIPGADKFVNLAYAEHYMYARYVVAETGDFDGEKLMIEGYEGRKVVAFLMRGKKDLKIGKYEPTPPSLEAVAWGLKGAEQGLKDYRDVHGKVTGALGEAIKKDSELIAKQLKLTPQQKNQLNNALQRMIDTQAKIKQLQRMLNLMKSIKGFLPKGLSAPCLSCEGGASPKVETSVSGKVLNSGGGAGGSGTAV